MKLVEDTENTSIEGEKISEKDYQDLRKKMETEANEIIERLDQLEQSRNKNKSAKSR